MTPSLKLRLGLALLLGPVIGAAMGAIGGPLLLSFLTDPHATHDFNVHCALAGSIAIPVILVVRGLREHRRN